MRIIDADAFHAELNAMALKSADGILQDITIYKIKKLLDKIPTVESERPQGEWIENNVGRIQCSICKGAAISTMTGCLMDRHLEQYKTKFCPWCGADMGKGDVDE